MNPKVQERIDRAKYPVVWTACTERDSHEEYAFINLPHGVLYQFGIQPPTFIPGCHIELVEPYGDADEPRRGAYFVPISTPMLDPSVVTNEPQVTVTEGDWSKPDHKPLEVKGDF